MSTVLVNEDYGELSYEILLGQPYLHAAIAEWSKEIKRECYEVLEDVKIMFKEDGYTKIYSAADTSNKKLQKFLTIFNFDIEKEDNQFILYSQEL